MKKVTPEIEQFIIDNHKGISRKRMADMVYERFGISISATPIKAVYKRHGLVSGVDGRFKPGHVPYTKGKTWDEFMSPEGQAASSTTQFKPGHVPHNGGTPVGTLRIRKAVKHKPGSKPYCFQKVAQPNVWRQKHRIEWEEHNGPIPEGYLVEFADGDTLNWHIDNLILVTRAQHGVKNRYGLRGRDPETTELCNTIADMKLLLGKLARERSRT